MARLRPGFYLSLLLLLSSACVVAVVDPEAAGRTWPRSVFRKAVELDPGASVSLENEEGNIEISGWNDNRMEISAEKGGESLKPGGIYFIGHRFSAPDIRVRRVDNAVRISAGERGNDEEDRVVHYSLRVPRSVNLDSIRNGRGRISVTDLYGRALLDADEGDIEIRNYSGSLDIRLGSGSVEAEVLDLRPQDSVRIKVERGDIVLLLEPEAAAQLIAEAPEGSVTSELDLGQPLPAKKITATLGGGQASIELTAVTGDIKIRKVEVPS
jgi:DUF4097 and DUF4098 domain-containing protein YvlB